MISIEIISVLPEEETTFPWSGHLGIRSHSSLLKILDKNKSTLLFTNTRNQSERWYQCLKFFLPEMEDKIALHHGRDEVQFCLPSLGEKI